MPEIMVLGEALIDVFAEPGVSLREAQSLHPSPGGAPANVAVAAARLGADVGFIGKVGADEFGYYLIDLLAGEGVDTSHFVADPRAPTMLAIVAAPSPTEQHFVLYEGANALLTPDDLPYDALAAVKVFVYGSVTLASESAEAAIQAARHARTNGVTVVFDVNLRPALWPDLDVARDRIAESVQLADVVKLNEAELAFLTGTRELDAGSQQILEQDTGLCCVSLGEDGAYFNNGAARDQAPAYAVDVRDTTGSGDAFVAGLAYQLSLHQQPPAALDKPTLRRIVAFANACGALAATQLGAMSASPTLAAVEHLQQTDT